MIPRNRKLELDLKDEAAAGAAIDEILADCQIELPTAAQQQRARERIIDTIMSFHHNERRKRTPLSRQSMRQAQIMLDAITTLQTILGGSRWERQSRIETRNKHLPKVAEPVRFDLLISNKSWSAVQYNVEMVRNWRMQLNIAATRHGEVIGGYPFCPPTEFTMDGETHKDYRGAEWREHLSTELDRLSVMVREQYDRAAERHDLLADDDIEPDDPLRYGKPRERLTKGELAKRANISLNNLLFDLDLFWMEVYGSAAPLSRIDDLDPPYKARRDRGDKMSDGQRFMRLISRVCESVGITLGGHPLFQRARDLRQKTKIRPAG